jgi:hypothetical protein
MMTNNWISLHVFYASNPNPLLSEAVAPLIDELRERGLIQRHFFIRYWQEGPHIRLRLLPAGGVQEDEVKRRAEAKISAYLQRRPSLYTTDNALAKTFYKDMFLTEYGEEKWHELYGKDGEMPLRSNNSWHYIPYEPEYTRYGGVDGVEVAEWHFEHASDMAIRLIRETNVHVRTIMLGRSIQMTLPFCFSFLEDDEQVIRFLAAYEKFWRASYPKEASDLTQKFEKKFSLMAERIQQRVAEIRRNVIEEQIGTLTPLEREWWTQMRELRKRIDDRVHMKKLVFQNSIDREPLIPDDPRRAYPLLLSNYIHMTNNRLGVSILDETYLAYVMRRALEELVLPTTRYCQLVGWNGVYC